MEKCNASYGDEEDYSSELQNFELKFFAGPPANEIWYFKRGVELAG